MSGEGLYHLSVNGTDRDTNLRRLSSLYACCGWKRFLIDIFVDFFFATVFPVAESVLVISNVPGVTGGSRNILPVAPKVPVTSIKREVVAIM